MDIKDLLKLLAQGIVGLIFFMLLAGLIVFIGDIFCYLKGNADSLQACRELPYMRLLDEHGNDIIN